MNPLRKKILRRYRSILRNLVRSVWVSPRLRAAVLRRAGIRAGRVIIRDGIRVLGDGLVIGDDVFINVDCFIEAEEQVRIDDSVSIGMGVRLLTVSHEIGGPEKRAGRGTSSPIAIGRGSWIGASVVVLPGVVVGEGSIIGAGSVVTRDVAPDSIVAGVPARVVRML